MTFSLFPHKAENFRPKLPVTKNFNLASKSAKLNREIFNRRGKIMKRAVVKTEETAKNGRKSSASRTSSVSKNARANGSQIAAFTGFDEKKFLKKISKMTVAERKKEIGRLAIEFINWEE